MKSNMMFCGLLSLLIVSSSALYIYVDREPFCFTLDPITPSHYNLYYESMAQQTSVSVSLSSSGLPDMTLLGRANSTVINSTTPVLICVRTEGQQQPVSIDFYSSQQKGVKQLALKSHVHQIHEQFMRVGMQLKQLALQEQFEEQRQAIQSQIILNHEKNIFLYSTIKVVLVILVIAIQIFFLIRSMGTQGVMTFFKL